MSTGATDDIQAVVDETIRFLTVRPEGDRWIGEAPAWFGEYLFGGFLLGQAVHAATRNAPNGQRIHSLHAYFLRPTRAAEPLRYRVTTLREGRTFTTRAVEAEQGNTTVFSMLCSFSADTDGYEYELPLGRDAPGPEDVPRTEGRSPGPWIGVDVGPTPAAPDGTRQSTHRHWFRMPGTLPDDPHLHAALIAFASDWTGTGGRPLRLDGDITGMVSLDHAVWFHRPARADAWHLYDVHSLVNAGGRGVLRGTMHDVERHIVASVAQEMRLRPVD
jgi:acyl-CoA thioesterase-2